MGFDIQELIGKVTDAFQKDDSLKQDFEKEPKNVVEKIVGKLPDGLLDQIVEGVKGLLASDKLGAVGNLLKGLF